MLIDNKFIYLSLPRRGSTSFHYSCILNGLSIETLNEYWNEHNSKIDFTSIDEKDIMNYIEHGHEPLIELGKKFGYEYPIIAVKRDRHEAFYSLYKHILFDLHRAGADKVYEHFKNISLDDLFFYKTENLLTKKTRWDVIGDYLVERNLISSRHGVPIKMDIHSEEYIINVIDILITPSTFWHNNDPNVIWFDIKNLSDMEKWVSEITEKPFNLKQVNSSKHMDSNLKLDSEFIKKYNSIYDYYDLPKSVKSLI
jgi:hypothetical protein